MMKAGVKHGYMCSNRTNTLSKSPSRLNNNKKYEELPIEHSENTMRSLEGRFRELQEKYSELLSIVQLRNKERQVDKAQLQRYRQQSICDKQQIALLRGMLNYRKKRSIQTQVEEQMLIGFKSMISRLEQSTIDQSRKRKPSLQKNVAESPKSVTSKLRQSRYLDQTKLSPKRSDELNLVKNLSSKYLNKHETLQRHKLSNSPYSKLRFVPIVDI